MLRNFLEKGTKLAPAALAVLTTSTGVAAYLNHESAADERVRWMNDIEKKQSHWLSSSSSSSSGRAGSGIALAEGAKASGSGGKRMQPVTCVDGSQIFPYAAPSRDMQVARMVSFLM
jgi:hypothetical protein